MLVDGEAVLYLDRAGRGVTTLPSFDVPGMRELALNGLLQLVERIGGRGLTVERIDGLAAAESPAAEVFLAAGFSAGYRGLTYRPATGGGGIAGRG